MKKISLEEIAKKMNLPIEKVKNIKRSMRPDLILEEDRLLLTDVFLSPLFLPGRILKERRQILTREAIKQIQAEVIQKISNFCKSKKLKIFTHGFRRIKWGTDIRTLPDMIYLETIPRYGGVQVYTRENDKLKIGGVALEKIEYYFWRGKFCGVMIYIKGFVNFDSLKQEVFEKFGKGYQYKYIEKYFWSGENTIMGLEYSKSLKMGAWWIMLKKYSHR